MNCKSFSVLFATAFCGAAAGQPALFYENNGLLVAPPAIPPNIDAFNFLNRGQFIINFTNFTTPALPPPVGLPPYETQNTLNYTNYFGHLMSCNTGFRMEMFNSQTGLRQRASSFFNDGTINCGTVDTTNYFVIREANFNLATNVYILGTFAGSKMLVNASNILSPGTINLGFESTLTLKGESVILTNGIVTMEPEGFSVSSGANIGINFNQGLFAGYWGVGDVASQLPVFYPFGITPPFYFEGNPVFTPIHPVTMRDQSLLLQTLILPNATSYVLDQTDLSTSNRFVRAVFLNNTNADVQANVYFPTFPDIAIEYTNKLGGFTNDYLGGVTNNLYILDYFGVLTNLSLLINDTAAGHFTEIPYNYEVFLEDPALINPFLGPPATAGAVPSGTFTQSAVTNQWSAYQVLLRPLSVVLEDNASQDPTNVPGRIEIVADKYLNLSRAHITSLNYLLMKATNHFGGSSRARIAAPVVDVNLRSTNGFLAITNLLAPVPHRPEGDIKLYSARWTNVSSVFGVTLTNRFHVLVADNYFTPATVSHVQDLILRSTNTAGGTDQIVISDILGVTRSFLLESSRLTIATNTPGSPTDAGAIYLQNANLVWPASTPRLQYLTNNGVIQTLNAVFFGGSRSSPYYSSNYNEPYEVFVNRGAITNFSSLIWAKTNFNSGTVFADGGSIELQQAQSAVLTNGTFLSPGGAISVASGSLFISNHVLQAGAAITLDVTNYLDDGSLANDAAAATNVATLFADPASATLFASVAAISNKNTWSAGYGFNLPTRPAQASLLGSTVFAAAPPGREVVNLWAADDLGCSPAGYSNNAALGRLILDGGSDSLFTFTGTGSTNALYLDYLELRNFTTNRDTMGNFLGVKIDPNMHIYFGQAVANGASIAEKLDGKNGGRFCWVAGHAGFYSSTNFVYPDGTTNLLNAALLDSHNLDSDCDGLPNYVDTDPIFLVTTAVLPDAISFNAYSAGLQAFGGPANPRSWALAPGSAPLPLGLSLSSDGVISGTPTESGLFAFTVRVTVTTLCGDLTTDRDLTIAVNAGAPMLSVAIENHSPPGALVTWQTLPNSMNYLYYRPSLTSGGWQLLTNFMSPAGGTVSVWDPVSTNVTRYYRVLVNQP